jgi:hypothetical protein
VEGVNDRLLSRFEGGLVVELGAHPGPGRGSETRAAAASKVVEKSPPLTESARREAQVVAASPGPVPSGNPVDDLSAVRELAGVTRGRREEHGKAMKDVVVATPKAAASGDWFPAQDKVVWDWPVLQDLIQEENGN